MVLISFVYGYVIVPDQNFIRIMQRAFKENCISLVLQYVIKFFGWLFYPRINLFAFGQNNLFLSRKENVFRLRKLPVIFI